MNSFFQLPLFGIGVSILFYLLCNPLGRLRIFLLNPVLWTITGIILFLKVFNISFDTYYGGGKYLTYFLGPAVVALGAFFYEKYEEVKRDLKIFSIAVITGGTFSVVSMIGFLLLFGMPLFLIQSLASKSVTTPIAIEITKSIGGIPDITAGIVIAVGIFGNVLGPVFLRKLGITDKKAIGAALGTAAHGIGTARALQEGKISGVYSGIAMCLNGVVTAFLVPLLIYLFLESGS